MCRYVTKEVVEQVALHNFANKGEEGNGAVVTRLPSSSQASPLKLLLFQIPYQPKCFAPQHLQSPLLNLAAIFNSSLFTGTLTSDWKSLSVFQAEEPSSPTVHISTEKMAGKLSTRSHNAAVEEHHPSKDWTLLTDRGGLYHVENIIIILFICSVRTHCWQGNLHHPPKQGKRA